MKLKLLLSLSICLTFAYIPINAQVEISDSNVSESLIQENDKLIVMDFYATWCGPCVKMVPIMEKLTNDYAGRVLFYKMDIDKNTIDEQLGIESIPTYYIIKNGITLEKFEGSRSEQEMKNIINRHLKIDYDNMNVTHNHRDDEFTDSYLSNFENNSSQLNNIAWHAYLEHNEVDVLLKALEVIEKSLSMNQNFYNLDTHAAILYKLGRYEPALKQAKSAIDMAKKDGFDYSGTSELLYKIIDKM